MTDTDLQERLEHLKKWVKKVKPKDHYVRGWEDARSLIMETIKELESRSKFMDFLQMKWAKEHFENHVREKALRPPKRDENGKIIPVQFSEEEMDVLIKITNEQFINNPVSPSWRK